MATPQVKCSTCGRIHLRDELELSFERPDAVAALPEGQRKSEVRESDDVCAIRSEQFFIRAVLPLPVHESKDPYRIGIWVEVERATFDRVLKLWDDSAQHEEPPFGATLANDIPSLQSTRGLPVRVQLTTSKTRPVVLVPECDHGLHQEQCVGITAHRASEYSSYIG